MRQQHIVTGAKMLYESFNIAYRCQIFFYEQLPTHKILQCVYSILTKTLQRSKLKAALIKR